MKVWLRWGIGRCMRFWHFWEESPGSAFAILVLGSVPTYLTLGRETFWRNMGVITLWGILLWLLSGITYRLGRGKKK